MGNSAKSTFLALLRDVIIFVPTTIIIAAVFKNIVTTLWAAIISDVVASVTGFFLVRSEIRDFEQESALRSQQ